LSGCFSLGLAWSTVNGVHYEKVELSSVFRSMEACKILLEALLPLTSVLLALYVCLRLTRFSKVVTEVNAVAGALEEIAMVVGCSVKERAEDDEVVKAFWMIYRHLNLVHVLIYFEISLRFEHQGLADLEKTGFISEDEKSSLDMSVDPPGLVTFWIGHLIVELHNAQVFDAHLIDALMRSISDLRSATSNLMQEVKRTAPISFVQLIQITIDAICLLSSPVLLHKFLSGRSYPMEHVPVFGTSTLTSTTTTTTTTTTTETGVAAWAMMFQHNRISIYMMPFVGSMIVTLLYQGTFQVVKDTEDPFATGMDRLNPDFVLDTTEKKIGAFLRKTSPNAKQIHFPNLASFYEKRRAAEQAAAGSADEAGGDYYEVDIDGEGASLPGRPRPEEPEEVEEGESAAPPPIAPEGRQLLPTAVVFSGVTVDKLTDGAHQDARDLHRGVHDKLEKLEFDLLQKLEEDDPYLVAVNDLLPKLQQDSLANSHLREQVVKAVAGMTRVEEEVLHNPNPLRRSRSIKLTNAFD